MKKKATNAIKISYLQKSFILSLQVSMMLFGFLYLEVTNYDFTFSQLRLHRIAIPFFAFFFVTYLLNLWVAYLTDTFKQKFFSPVDGIATTVSAIITTAAGIAYLTWLDREIDSRAIFLFVVFYSYQISYALIMSIFWVLETRKLRRWHKKYRSGVKKLRVK